MYPSKMTMLAVVVAITFAPHKGFAQVGKGNPMDGGPIGMPNPQGGDIGPIQIPPYQNQIKIKFPRAKLELSGVEQTQGVQYFRSQLIADPANPEAGPQPDNSIPLVAGRPTALRYYFDATVPLLTSGHIVGSIKLTAPGLSPKTIAAPLSAVAQPLDKVDRGEVSHTLNFSIPAEYAKSGLKVQLTAELLAGRKTPVSAPVTMRKSLAATTSEMTMSFIDMPTPTLSITELRVTQPGHDPLSEGQVKREFEKAAQKIFPVPTYRVVSAIFPYGGQPVMAGTFILQNEQKLREASSRDAYIAVLPWSRDSVNDITSGLADYSRRGAAMYYDYLRSDYLAFNLAIGACGLGEMDGPRYSTTYDKVHSPLPRGSIGEFGFDPVALKVYKPDTTDFMAAAWGITEWVSPYNYKKLLNCFQSGASEHPGS